MCCDMQNVIENMLGLLSWESIVRDPLGQPAKELVQAETAWQLSTFHLSLGHHAGHLHVSFSG